MLYTDVDASEFKFFEVKIGAETLLSALAGFLGYYLLIFTARLVLVALAHFREGRERREKRIESFLKARAEREAMMQERAFSRGSESMILSVMSGPMTINVILFEFVLPWGAGAYLLAVLLQRVNVWTLIP